jgi:hypothetical protein
LEAMRRPERIRGAEGERCAAGAVHVEPPHVPGAAVVPHCTGEIVSHPPEHRQRDWPRWASLGSIGQVWTGTRAPLPGGKSERPARLLSGVWCGVTHAAHGAQERRAWTLGKIRRIQADPGRSLQSPRFTLEPARTPDKRGAVERARTAGRVAAEVISPWSGLAADRGRSGAWSRPGRRAALALASPASRQSRRERAKAPERAARPGVTTGAAWSDQRRAPAFPLAFFPALKSDFAASFPALKPDSAALSPGSQQRRTNTPHMEGCPSWESIPTIT